MMGFLQPDAWITLVITAADEDGDSNDRVCPASRARVCSMFRENTGLGLGIGRRLRIRMFRCPSKKARGIISLFQ
ncbi:MAG: hypothetical protein CL933_05025 [Deltaproteobacteria bacterium]|nr:hypothetical protein [Deltaproteobacteria bacterium]